MKTVQRIFLIIVIAVGLLSLVFIFWFRDRYVVPIITYHHVGVPSDKSLYLNTVSTNSFERQMRFLKKHRYTVISFSDLVEGLSKGRLFQRDTVVVQFDDGYDNNYTNAFPVLKKYEFPAMVFLVSDFIGVKPGFLTWDQVKEMEGHGFLAGAHTRHHLYLPHLSVEELRDEIAGSKRIIEEHLGHKVDYFAYPNGGFNVPAKEIAKEVGFKAAVTTNRGKDRFNKDFYEMKRIRIKDSDGDFALWFKLSGYYNLFRGFKSGGCELGDSACVAKD